jgi:hypothetical protein
MKKTDENDSDEILTDHPFSHAEGLFPEGCEKKSLLLAETPFGGFEPGTKLKLAAERVPDQSATGTSRKKNKTTGLVLSTLPKFRPSLP